MKKLTAFLLTLTLLLSMVGTVSLAADETKGTTFPKESVIIDAAGNVAVSFAGVEAFDAGSAIVSAKTKDGKTVSVPVKLTYDSTKKVFTGTNKDAASGIIVNFNLKKSETKTATDGSSTKITNTATFQYFTTDTLKGKLATASITKKTEATTKDGFKAKETEDNQEVRYDGENGRIYYDKAVVTEKTYGKKGQNAAYTETVTDKSYFTGTGVYSGKKVTVLTSTYDANGTEVVKRTTSEKNYNLDNKLVGTGDSTLTVTYNAAKDLRTIKTDGVEKTISTKNLTKETTTNHSTGAQTLINGVFRPASFSSEAKTTDRDGKLKHVLLTGANYYNGELLVYSMTSKDYNTYTGKLVYEDVWTRNVTEDKTTKEKKSIYTETETFNNDDGSLRKKIVSGLADDEEYETEIHYNKDNKIVATKDKNGTWKDGLGNVIGTNTYKDGDYTRTDVSFKERTGEIHWYSTSSRTTNKDNITIETTVSYNGKGAKISDYKKVTNNNDKSYAEYQNGVMSTYYTQKDGVQETRSFDMKGTLKQTVKNDTNKGVKTTYDYRGKVKEIVEKKEDGTTTTATYDPATEKLKEMSIEKGNVTGYYNGLGMLVYTTEYNSKTGTTIYRDPGFGEFARTYTKGSQYGTLESQKLVKEPTTKSADVTVEKEVSTKDYKVKETTTTNDFTKWSVTSGIKGPDVTRKEVIKQTYSDDTDKTTVTKDGILTKDTTKAKNAYDDVTKTTVTYYDWYTGALSGKTKDMSSGRYNDGDKVSYNKVYDKYNNLQTYSVTDDTDSWNWNKTYYASGMLKSESWQDYLDYDSSYSATYYIDGTPDAKYTNNQGTANFVDYNRDGSWYEWADTANGVTNSWLYDTNGDLAGYAWNQKSENGVHSYDHYDADSNLVFSYVMEDDILGKVRQTRTDPAGNKWVKWDDQVTLTLAKGGSGWQNAVGVWFYVENGKPVTSQWKKIDGSWYYFDDDGFMKTGIISEEKKNLAAGDMVPDKVYALDGVTGALVTGGWVYVGDYRHDAWAFADANGEVVTGWQQIGGKWYYFEDGWDDGHSAEYKAEAKWTQKADRGTMVAGRAASIWNSDWKSKHTYFFNADGTWDNSPGWKCAESVVVGSLGADGETSDSSRYDLQGVEWHYYDKNGKEVTGWNKIDGEWYFFNEDGVMKNGWVKSGDKWYFMDPVDGAMATNGWVEDVYEGWYYMDKNGQYQTGWLKDGNQWYYLKSDGAMAENEWAKSGNNWYYMDKNGQIATGWIQDKGSWYYLKSDGAMKTGWEGSGTTWYYLGEDGAMVTNTDKTIDGKVYHFDENGLCTNPY